MKNICILGLILLFATVACTNNKKSSVYKPTEGVDYSTMMTSENLGIITRFIPLDKAKNGQVANIKTGELYSQWKTIPNLQGSTEEIGVQWGHPGAPKNIFSKQVGTEVWGIKHDSISGYNFVWLHGYGDDEGNITAKLKGTKVLLVNNKREEFDITYTCSEGGNPYMLYDLYDEEYVLKVWHDIIHPLTGIVLNRAYWEHIVTPFVEKENPVWQGDGSKNRLTVKQEEVWWDGSSDWVHGSGDIDAETKEPNGKNIKYGRAQWWGDGGWFAWALQDYENDKIEGGLKYGWDNNQNK